MSGPLLDAIVIPGILGVWAIIVVLVMVPSDKTVAIPENTEEAGTDG